MSDRFAACLPFVLQQEGGNDDDPRDPGGRTSRGIIQREYNAYRKRKGLAPADVWKASDAEIAEIYRTQYWEPYCPQMPAGVDLSFFDNAVNEGPYRAAVLLQRALGVRDDGRIGPVTLNAIDEADPKLLINNYASRRLAFYRSLATFKYFSKGWTARTEECRAASLRMLGQEVA